MSINYLLQLLKAQFTQSWYPKALWVKTMQPFWEFHKLKELKLHLQVHQQVLSQNPCCSVLARNVDAHKNGIQLPLLQYFCYINTQATSDKSFISN